MCECKRPSGGVQSAVQSDYEEKYKNFKNVHYQIITSPEELEYSVKKLCDTEIPAHILQDMDDHMNNVIKPTKPVMADDI
jgi:hypothetical protein